MRTVKRMTSQMPTWEKQPGAVFAAGHHAAPLIACGALKIIYDLALLAAFRHVKPPEER